jgi:hypothetical protein
MAFKGKNVNHPPGLRLICLLLLLAWAGAAGAADTYQVQPVAKPEDLRLLPSSAWPPPEAEGPEMLMKLTYLRGMLDALQYAQVAPRGVGKALTGLAGMSLNQLAAALDQYYLADPRRRELPPAAVLMRILPEQRAQPQTGQTPSAPPAPVPAPPAPPEPGTGN